MMEDAALPRSPNSVQSDSENSASSSESPAPEQQIVADSTSNNRLDIVKCCWVDCGLQLETLDELASHVSKMHAQSGLGGLYYCGWDGCPRNNKGFNARYKMLVHVRTHTNEKPHRCNECQKSFSRAENLKIHIRSHSGEKPYVCPVVGCNKAYSNSSDRFKHTRTHQVDKPYRCKVPGCQKKYTDPSSLRKHVKTYKHFAINSESEVKIDPCHLPDNNVISTNYVEALLSPPSPVETVPLNARQEHYSHLTETREIIQYGSYLSFKAKCDSIYVPFSSYSDEMEIDMPLDLSMSAKHI